MSTIEQALEQFPFNKGAMLGASKSAYAYSHPNDKIVFNANLCTKRNGKIWWGDLNITKSEQHLAKLANDIGEDLYVLYEMDARFEFENNPQFHKAVRVFNTDNPTVDSLASRVYALFHTNKD